MMPDLNDFHAFKSTSSGSGGGGSTGCLPWFLGILALIWFVGKISG